MTNKPHVFKTTNENDIVAAYAIHKEVVFNHWSYSTFSDCTTTPYTFLVSKQDDKVIGYAIVLLVTDEATLMDVALAHEARGQGNGKVLMQGVVDFCEDKGASSIWLEVRASNIIAKNLYQSYSFHTVEIRKNYYSTGDIKEDAVIMQRICRNI